MIDEQGFAKDLKGSYRGPVQVQSKYLPGGTEKNYEAFHSG
jgi:hypothetical protein